MIQWAWNRPCRYIFLAWYPIYVTKARKDIPSRRWTSCSYWLMLPNLRASFYFLCGKHSLRVGEAFETTQGSSGWRESWPVFPRWLSAVGFISTMTIGLNLTSNRDKTLKTTALDVEQYRSETSVKYPSFTPPKTAPANLAESPISRSNSSKLTHRLSQAYNPIPLRHHYHHDDLEPTHTGMLPGQSTLQQTGPNGPFRGNSQPPTPAPSPPPSPKPKKQQYQTDQNRPFLLPFSGKKGENATLVPFAIDEAEGLFNKHLYVSLMLAQMWRTREDCMTCESGLEKMPGMDDTYRSSTFLSNVSVSFIDFLWCWTWLFRRLKGSLCLISHK